LLVCGSGEITDHIVEVLIRQVGADRQFVGSPTFQIGVFSAIAQQTWLTLSTTTPEDAPRGIEFLYSLNRLNVAVPRARFVAVIVANPALFQVQCKTPSRAPTRHRLAGAIRS
jgi:hypothetical protein